PPPTPDPEGARPWFTRLRGLLEDLRTGHPDLAELSMGMSGDYRVAVEEGATMVRVGTALFGPRPLPASARLAREAPADPAAPAEGEGDARGVEEAPSVPRAGRGRGPGRSRGRGARARVLPNRASWPARRGHDGATGDHRADHALRPGAHGCDPPGGAEALQR